MFRHRHETRFSIEETILRAETACHYGLGDYGKHKASCVNSTIAFTHPTLIKRLALIVKVSLDDLEAVSKKVTRISGERTRITQYDALNPPTEVMFTKALRDAHAAWIGVAGDKDLEVHLLGVLKKDESRFFIWRGEGEIVFGETNLKRLVKDLKLRTKNDNFYAGEIVAFKRR